MKRFLFQYFFIGLAIFFCCSCAGTSGNPAGELARQFRLSAAANTLAESSPRKDQAAPDYLEIANDLMERGFFDIALAQLETALSDGIDNPRLRCLKGVCLREKGELEKARTEFEKALQMNPNIASAYGGLGMIAALKGYPDASLDYYQKAVSHDPASPALLNNLAVTLMAQNRTDEAIKQLKLAVSIAPDFKRAWNNLGIAYALSGKNDDAVNAFRVSENEATATENLAFVQWHSGVRNTTATPSSCPEESDQQKRGKP